MKLHNLFCNPLDVDRSSNVMATHKVDGCLYISTDSLFAINVRYQSENQQYLKSNIKLFIDEMDENWTNMIVRYVAQNQGDFLFYIFCLTFPLFLLSGFLSIRLANKLQNEKKNLKKIEKIIMKKKQNMKKNK